MDCIRCGWCCKETTIEVTYSDLMRWQREQHREIMQEISFIKNYPSKGTGGFYIAKTTFNPKRACPFYITVNGVMGCHIYTTRPIACRDFPYGIPTIQECAINQKIIIPARRTKRVKRAQYRDFKRAFDNWENLLQDLIHARRAVHDHREPIC